MEGEWKIRGGRIIEGKQGEEEEDEKESKRENCKESRRENLNLRGSHEEQIKKE